MMLSPLPRSGVQSASDWAGGGADTFWTRWGGGWVFPLMCLSAGFACIVLQKAIIPGFGRLGWYGYIVVYGFTATAAGVACIGAAIYLHSRCYWYPRLHHVGIAQIGEAAGLLVFLAGMITVIYRVIAY